MPSKRSTVYAILGLLAIKPMSAYELVKFSKETIGFFWNESYGNIHKNLRQLAEEGWVDLIRAESQHRQKKTYAITPAGRQHLRQWLKAPPEEVLLRDELLLKLFVSEKEDIAGLSDFVRQEAEEMQQAIQVLSGVRQSIAALDQDPTRKELWLLTLDYGKSYAETRLAWCRQVDRQLKN